MMSGQDGGCNLKFLPQDPHFATNACHHGQDPEKQSSWAIVPPISMSTTFKQDAPAQHRGFEYSRSGNPTRLPLEECLASLEQGKYGFAFASGLAATTTVCHLLKSGDHILAMNDMYGGTYRYFNKILTQHGIEVSMVDPTSTQAIVNAIQPNTKMIWAETPTNPTMKITDIRRVCEVAHGKKKDIVIVVDNTFQSSYFQKPLLLGADIVMHSMTKYMNGHSDVVMGALMCNSDELAEKIKFLQNSLGTVPSPFDSYLVLRSLKTLHLRMREHMKNGLAVAKFLEGHQHVERVLHAGLPSHPQHELAVSQSYGFSGMCSFYMKGDRHNVDRFFKHIKVFTLAESLGGYESLAELPSVMTHASVAPADRAIIGITDTLVRLSVGLEDLPDLIQDLNNALNYAFSSE